MGARRLFYTFLLASCFVRCNFYPNNRQRIHENCPRLFHKVFWGYVPQGNLSAGYYDEKGEMKLEDCVMNCCSLAKCNVAFISKEKCYHITCISNDLCMPVLNVNGMDSDQIGMVLVKPTDDDSWENLLAPDNARDFQTRDDGYPPFNDGQRLADLLKEESINSVEIGCNVGIDSLCGPHAICEQNSPKSRAGTCRCKSGYTRIDNGDCFLYDEMSSLPDIITDRILDITSNKSVDRPVTRKPLIVTAESKEVKLPDSEVTLDAVVAPTDVDNEKYQYEWISLLQPEGSITVKHQNGGQLHLEKLSEGIYAFRVTASSAAAYGETFVNVTVLPASRINKPPVIIITPANQSIKQPNSAAVLDASSSTDDDRITAWHWELQQGPLGYQPDLKDTPTLQLNDLTRPGNYSFKLTVTDSDQATSTSTANITVLKNTDYPPEANAGVDQIIYLPHNAITLNGNLSIDDHAITTWEWTKSADDAQKAVDMQDTRTPYLQLSNLEEGMYTFTLRVTDSANQSSTAQVHVFVKPPTNKPPVANAGGNQSISLPQTWVVLDAAKSTDDNKIVEFKWEQVNGPSNVVFESFNSSQTNVTGLTKGSYTFKCSVTDDNKNVASDLAYVIVNQNKNQKPTANAGEDFTVELPLNAVFINGSNSKDDWAIVKWKWTRNGKSLALAKIAETSDTAPILILTDLNVGKYAFNLTVYDEQGLSDTDTVTFTVKNDPKLFYLVEITIDIDANSLEEDQYDTLKLKLALIVNDGAKLVVRGVAPVPGTGKSRISFYVANEDGKPVSANDVVQHLREKLRRDASILGATVLRLQTSICQNNCSDHGVCNEQTRMCECEAFWMQNMFKVYLKSDEDSDCSWSILYVVLGLLCTVFLFIGSLWGVVYLCVNWCAKNRATTKPTTYKLIQDTEDLPPFSSRKSNISDSDTDSDVVFETRSKPSRFSESRNGHKISRNGFSKSGRRVKT